MPHPPFIPPAGSPLSPHPGAHREVLAGIARAAARQDWTPGGMAAEAGTIQAPAPVPPPALFKLTGNFSKDALSDDQQYPFSPNDDWYWAPATRKEYYAETQTWDTPADGGDSDTVAEEVIIWNARGKSPPTQSNGNTVEAYFDDRAGCWVMVDPGTPRVIASTLYSDLADTDSTADIGSNSCSPLDGGLDLPSYPTEIGNTAGWTGSEGDIVIFQETSDSSDLTAAAAWEIISLQHSGTGYWQPVSSTSQDIYYETPSDGTTGNVIIGQSTNFASPGNVPLQVAGNAYVNSNGGDLLVQGGISGSDPTYGWVAGIPAISSPTHGAWASLGGIYCLDNGSGNVGGLDGCGLSIYSTDGSISSGVLQTTYANGGSPAGSLGYISYSAVHTFYNNLQVTATILDVQSPTSKTSIDPNGRLLVDASGTYTSLDWNNRYLIDSAGTTQLVWDTGGVKVENTLWMEGTDPIAITNASGVLTVDCNYGGGDTGLVVQNEQARNLSITLQTDLVSSTWQHQAVIKLDTSGNLYIIDTLGPNGIFFAVGSGCAVTVGGILSATSYEVHLPDYHVAAVKVGGNAGYNGTINLSGHSFVFNNGILTGYT